MELADYLKQNKPQKPVFVYLAGRATKQVSSVPLLGCDNQKIKNVVTHKRKICADAGMILITRFDKIGSKIAEYFALKQEKSEKKNDVK